MCQVLISRQQKDDIITLLLHGILIFSSPVPTIKIPSKKTTVLTDERKKKQLFEICCKFKSICQGFTSCSVYKDKGKKADIVPYFNKILLTQEHKKNTISKNVESATNLINLRQTIVDTSDQLVRTNISTQVWTRDLLSMFGECTSEINDQLLLVMDFLGFLTIQNFQSLVLEIQL